MSSVLPIHVWISANVDQKKTNNGSDVGELEKLIEGRIAVLAETLKKIEEATMAFKVHAEMPSNDQILDGQHFVIQGSLQGTAPSLNLPQKNVFAIIGNCMAEEAPYLGDLSDWSNTAALTDNIFKLVELTGVISPLKGSLIPVGTFLEIIDTLKYPKDYFLSRLETVIRNSYPEGTFMQLNDTYVETNPSYLNSSHTYTFCERELEEIEEEPMLKVKALEFLKQHSLQMSDLLNIYYSKTTNPRTLRFSPFGKLDSGVSELILKFIDKQWQFLRNNEMYTFFERHFNYKYDDEDENGIEFTGSDLKAFPINALKTFEEWDQIDARQFAQDHNLDYRLTQFVKTDHKLRKFLYASC